MDCLKAFGDFVGRQTKGVRDLPGAFALFLHFHDPVLDRVQIRVRAEKAWRVRRIAITDLDAHGNLSPHSGSARGPLFGDPLPNEVHCR
jgi:hypothetical protein